MIVITLSKVPNSLRGDLTKWCQEIQTGVYVGNFSARIRDLLWERINDNIGNGEATLVYSTNNEIGYQFKTTRKDRTVMDFDGIPLMVHLNENPVTRNHGFSNAAKSHRARIMTSRTNKREIQNNKSKGFVVLDIETTGLHAESDEIISIGAVKYGVNSKSDEFYELIKVTCDIPEKIVELTGITQNEVKSKGVELDIAIKSLREFVGNDTIVGYNIKFDMNFLDRACSQCGEDDFENETIDILSKIKRIYKFLDNYRLGTVLSECGIINKHPHNALSDAKAILELVDKLKENGSLGI